MARVLKSEVDKVQEVVKSLVYGLVMVCVSNICPHTVFFWTKGKALHFEDLQQFPMEDLTPG